MTALLDKAVREVNQQPEGDWFKSQDWLGIPVWHSTPHCPALLETLCYYAAPSKGIIILPKVQFSLSLLGTFIMYLFLIYLQKCIREL